jgi:hypothetical protein
MKGLNTLESKDAFEKFYKTTYGGNKWVIQIYHTRKC